MGLPPAPVPILSLGLGRGNIPIARFAHEAFPNAGLVDVGNYRAAREKMDVRGIEDSKIRDAIRVEALIGAGKFFFLLNNLVFIVLNNIFIEALNADAALDGNRRHRHHRRRHPSEVKGPNIGRGRGIPKDWGDIKNVLHPGQHQKSSLSTINDSYDKNKINCLDFFS